MASSGYEYFISQGWTPIQSAGIMGNLVSESKLDPRAIGDNGSAFGIAQWRGSRITDIYNNTGIDVRSASYDQQLQAVQWELVNRPYLGGAQLAGATDLNSATSIFMNKYERPANDSSLGRRINAGAEILQKGADIVAKGTNIINGVSDTVKGAINKVPVIGDIASGLGLTSDCGWLCQIKNWLSESQFWKRAAIVVLALIMIGGALYLFGTGKVTKMVKGLA